MSDIYEFDKHAGRKKRNRPKRPKVDPLAWLSDPELQEYITEAVYNTQNLLVNLCDHSARTRMGQEEYEKRIERLVKDLLHVVTRYPLPLGDILLTVDSLRGELMYHVMEQVAYTAGVIPPWEAMSTLMPQQHQEPGEGADRT